MADFCSIAEKALSDRFKSKFEVTAPCVPDAWKEWIPKAGINSICNDETWGFLEKAPEAHKNRWDFIGINKIILKVQPECKPDEKWRVAQVQWDFGENREEMTIVFFPHAKTLKSERCWNEEGEKKYWNLSGEITLALNIYQLPGPCFYKSGWLTSMQCIEGAPGKYRRWFQFRHWILFWYNREVPGYNCPLINPQRPPANQDGTPFSMEDVTKLPSTPGFTMPPVTLPQLPQVVLPTSEMETIDAPMFEPEYLPLDAPQSARQRPKARWAAHGYIEFDGRARVSHMGPKLVISNATITDLWENNGTILPETRAGRRFDLVADETGEAESWYRSFREAGMKEDTGGCCSCMK